MEKPHWMNVRESYSRALEQETLPNPAILMSRHRGKHQYVVTLLAVAGLALWDGLSVFFGSAGGRRRKEREKL